MFGLFKRKPAPPPASPPSEGYKAYTRQFDRETTAHDLVKEIRAQGPNFAAESSDLLRLFKSPSLMRTKADLQAVAFQARWRSGHDLGERPLVTLLIDHSGSMKGPKALAAATAADVLGRILEHERIDFEVLGYTTQSWKGGRSRRMWIRNRRPPNPGRLCDLLHVVYHAASNPGQQSWARDLIVMLDPEVPKENVDGEALQWARARADAVRPTAWICLLLGDGVSVDDSTILANGAPVSNWYLARHVESVAGDLKADATVRLGCLSLEREPVRAFQSLRIVDLLEDAPAGLFHLLEELIWPPQATEAATPKLE
ncbi:MAG TPA: hypothetical protein VGO52_08285 [Hyphomonadaceae bacterium]|nr:hypothetical protein [Hyphomonadaceae bacterium]